MHKLTAGANYRHYPRSLPWARYLYYEFRPTVIWGLDGEWESYRFFTAPINWRLESGDRFEVNANPEGERLEEPFEIADGVVIAPGSYHYVRYRLEWELAAKRMVSGQLTWWFGGFYDGTLDQMEGRVLLRPSELVVVELNGTRYVGRLGAGDFDQQVLGLRTQVNVSPDLQVASLVQYDDESRKLGTNTRLRWTFSPLGEIFLVYNYNVVDDPEPMTPSAAGAPGRHNRWALDATQLLLKVQYAVRW
jgi:hypothetical protein